MRPLVDPIAVSPCTMVHRRDLRRPAVDALTSAVDQLAADERWRQRPPSAWTAGRRLQALGDLSVRQH